MGLLDNLGDKAEKAKELVGDHADQVEKGIDKAADLIDDKTGGKHSDQIGNAADKAKDTLGKLGKK